MEPDRDHEHADHGADDAAHDAHAGRDDYVVMNGNGHVDLDAELLADSAQGVVLPAWSTRGSAPGPRGCWATNKHGEPCGAARRAEGDYCNAHSGLGVAADPSAWAPRAGKARAVQRRRQAALRLQLGITRQSTPRGVLRAHAYVEAERIAARVVDAVLDENVAPAVAARLGLDLIDTVDPQATMTASVTAPSTPEGVAELSLSQLLAVGQSMGIDPSPHGSIEP